MERKRQSEFDAAVALLQTLDTTAKSSRSGELDIGNISPVAAANRAAKSVFAKLPKDIFRYPSNVKLKSKVS